MTVRHVAQRIPFRPNNTQKALLEQCFGARRFVYNQQVEAFNTYDKETNPNPEYLNVSGMKNANGWLRDSPIPSNERVEQLPQTEGDRSQGVTPDSATTAMTSSTNCPTG